MAFKDRRRINESLQEIPVDTVALPKVANEHMQLVMFSKKMFLT
jgi:hypothetical protein